MLVSMEPRALASLRTVSRLGALALLVLAHCAEPPPVPAPDATASAHEGAEPGDCSNGADDDRDGYFDCDDDSCLGARACVNRLDASVTGRDATTRTNDAGGQADIGADTAADPTAVDEHSPSPVDCSGGECGAQSAWGVPLSAYRGVCAYSNGADTKPHTCVDPPYSADGQFPVGCDGSSATSFVGPANSIAGLAFQCVDFARKVTMARLPTWTTIRGNACVWWRNAPAGLKHPNRGTEAPRPDDLIVFDPPNGTCACPTSNNCRVGHIGVIVKVDADAGHVVVLDQNNGQEPFVLAYTAGATHHVADMMSGRSRYPTLGWLRVSATPDQTCGVRRYIRDPSRPNAAPPASFEQLVSCPPGAYCDLDSLRCEPLSCDRDVRQPATEIVFDASTHCFTPGPYRQHVEGCSAVIGIERSPAGLRSLLMRDLNFQDPSLISPRLDWNVTADHAVRIEMACTGIQPARADARVFVATNEPAPVFESLPSVGPIPVTCDGTTRTYDFPLATIAAHVNNIGWLRLDPLDGERRFSDGRVWIRSIRLVRGAPLCGNRRLDPGEVCDGTELAGASCASLGFSAGKLNCDAACSLNRSGCCNHECPSSGSTSCADPQSEVTCGGFDNDQCLDLGAGRSCVNGCSRDRCRPYLRIDQPTNGASYSTARQIVDVAGTFGDATSVRWTAVGANTGACTLSGNRFACASIPLVDGSQDLTVVATNGVDSTSARLRVTRVSPRLAVTPSTGPQGTTFSASGLGYTPNGAVNLRATGPNGTIRNFSGGADGTGLLIQPIVSDTTFGPGRWSVVADDLSSQFSSPAATFDVLAAQCTGPSTQACGNCGTESRSCVGGQWSAWGNCINQGVCAAGSTRACNSTGTESCTVSCQWSGSCTGGCTQPCAAGSMRCGASGNVETCSANGCGWTISQNCSSAFVVPGRCCDDLRVRAQHECIPASPPSVSVLLDPLTNTMVRPGAIRLVWSALPYSDRYRISVCTNAALNAGCVRDHFETPFGQTEYTVNLGAGTWYWSVAAIRACDVSTWGPFAGPNRLNVQ
jgi:hypothetical protein